MKNRPITGVILAAGKGSRYGQDKRLIDIDGKPMLDIVAAKLSSLLTDSLVVLDKNDTELASHLHENNINTLLCHDAELGMGHSLACAVKARPASQAWMICLADMPYIEISTYASVVNTMLTGSSLCAPLYQGRRGHPVAFGRQYRDELVELSGDKGAREILARHANRITKLHVNDPGVLIDIDRPHDLPDITTTAV